MESFPFQAEVFRHIKCYDLKCISNQNFLYGGEARTENKVLASRSKKTRSPSHCQYNILLLTCYNNTGIEGSKQLDNTR